MYLRPHLLCQAQMAENRVPATALPPRESPETMIALDWESSETGEDEASEEHQLLAEKHGAEKAEVS